MRTSSLLVGIVGVALSAGAQAAIVTSTLNNVVILGATYNVTFRQDTSGDTTFNMVFGAGTPLTWTFGASNAAQASAQLLSAVDAAGFDVTPGFNDPSSELFVLPFADGPTGFNYYVGWRNTPGNTFVGAVGPFEVARTANLLGSFVTFEPAPRRVPEPGGLALSALALLGAWAARRRR